MPIIYVVRNLFRTNVSNIAIQAVNVKAEQKVPERNEIGDLCFNNLRDKSESSVSLGPSRGLSDCFQPKDKGKLLSLHILVLRKLQNTLQTSVQKV